MPSESKDDDSNMSFLASLIPITAMRLVLLFASFFACVCASAQPVLESVAHAVPFASEGNQIELTVANPAGVSMQAVLVTAADLPAWLTLTPMTVSLDVLDAGAEAPALFTFSVAETAPVGMVTTVRFEITAGKAIVGEKQIRLQVEAPTEIALKGNYPNPFNPSTTIGYALPRASKVSLRVYDMLGREVAQVVGRQQGAGYHEAVFEGSRYASGMYVYRLMVEDEAGGRTVRQDKMLLLK